MAERSSSGTAGTTGTATGTGIHMLVVAGAEKVTKGSGANCLVRPKSTCHGIRSLKGSCCKIPFDSLGMALCALVRPKEPPSKCRCAPLETPRMPLWLTEWQIYKGATARLKGAPLGDTRGVRGVLFLPEEL